MTKSKQDFFKKTNVFSHHLIQNNAKYYSQCNDLRNLGEKKKL
jgi:hypothetical protein